MKNNTLVTASINLEKIDKSKLVKGAKGTYANLTMWISEEADQYGNHISIQQSLSKEEREAGNDKIYLGNGKIYSSDGGSAPASTGSTSSEDLPF